ncbi:hypothetical protein NL676_025353 [Syzygium grande]|nr:hypothetical protein NL676_025353 [Syzygium grande]
MSRCRAFAESIGAARETLKSRSAQAQLSLSLSVSFSPRRPESLPASPEIRLQIELALLLLRFASRPAVRNPGAPCQVPSRSSFRTALTKSSHDAVRFSTQGRALRVSSSFAAGEGRSE